MTSTTRTRKPSKRETDRQAALDYLRPLYPAGSTVQTKLLHVSRSGMLRSFAVLVGNPDGSVTDVSWAVARAIGAKLHNPTGGVSMGGCGMDMGYALAYSLSRVLFADGFTCNGSQHGWTDDATGVYVPRCPSNDHVNDRAPDYGYDRQHSDPGYALNHRHL